MNNVNQCGFEQIPKFVRYELFSYMSLLDLTHLQKVSKFFNENIEKYFETKCQNTVGKKRKLKSPTWKHRYYGGEPIYTPLEQWQRAKKDPNATTQEEQLKSIPWSSFDIRGQREIWKSMSCFDRDRWYLMQPNSMSKWKLLIVAVGAGALTVEFTRLCYLSNGQYNYLVDNGTLEQVEKNLSEYLSQAINLRN